MSQQIDAIYDGGVLKPLVPLSLPDKTRVRVTVEAQPLSTNAAELEALSAALAPIREAFKASELSEEDAVDLFEAEKHALRNERSEL